MVPDESPVSLIVGRGRFELPTSCVWSMRSKPTELTTRYLSSFLTRRLHFNFLLKGVPAILKEIPFFFCGSWQIRTADLMPVKHAF